MKIILALPVYNEEHGLPLLLEAFQRAVYAAGEQCCVVLVDDGSTDRTPEVIQRWAGSSTLQILAVCHFPNMGLGSTMRDLLRESLRVADTDDDVIVTMDADNTHSPRLIQEMLAHIRVGGSDMVIASRFLDRSEVIGLGPWRTLMSLGAGALFHLLCPIPGVRDYTCGFRAYRTSLLRRAIQVYGDSLITDPGFACMAEILLKLSRLNPRISEVPMTLRYDLKHGASKMPRGTVLRTLRLAVKFALGRF